MTAARIATALAGWMLAMAAALAMSWLGPDALDAQPAADQPVDSLALAIAAEIDEDIRTCQALYGENATALWLPDGQHRCVDKHGRRLQSPARPHLSKAAP